MPVYPMEKDSQEVIKKVLIVAAFMALLVVSFLVVQPFIPPILTALILAYVLRGPYRKLNKKFKKPNTLAFLFCLAVTIILFIVVLFLAQIAIGEIIKFYSHTQTQDVLAPLRVIFAKLGPTEGFSAPMGVFFDQAIEKGASSLMTFATTQIMNIPFLILQLFVLLFILFYSLKDSELVSVYVKNILPFRKKIRDRFFIRFKQVTSGVIYGMVLLGAINGIVCGIGFYALGAPSPFILTILATLLGILPVIGTWAVWMPVSIGMMMSGSPVMGAILFVYCAVATNVSTNLVLPRIVGKKARLSNAIALVGMLGGLQLFGIIGLIIGPLILDYLILFIEFYKRKQIGRLI